MRAVTNHKKRRLVIHFRTLLLFRVVLCRVVSCRVVDCYSRSLLDRQIFFIQKILVWMREKIGAIVKEKRDLNFENTHTPNAFFGFLRLHLIPSLE